LNVDFELKVKDRTTEQYSVQGRGCMWKGRVNGRGESGEIWLMGFVCIYEAER
jgi:hypothetical protein